MQMHNAHEGNTFANFLFSQQQVLSAVTINILIDSINCCRYEATLVLLADNVASCRILLVVHAA